MTKVIVATHGDVPSGLLGVEFRNALAEAGVRQLQLNVDDDAVTEALRFGPDQPITALISAWTDGELGPVVDLVKTASGDATVHAYRVAERVRLDPTPTPDGVRADVMAQIALLRRPATMSPAEYLDYWMLRHTPIAIRTQNTSAYVQNIVEEALTPNSPDIAAIVEEHFPMAAMHDPHEFYGSRGNDAELNRRITELMASVAAFGADTGLDLVPTSRYVWHLG